MDCSSSDATWEVISLGLSGLVLFDGFFFILRSTFPLILFSPQYWQLAEGRYHLMRAAQDTHRSRWAEQPAPVGAALDPQWGRPQEGAGSGHWSRSEGWGWWRSLVWAAHLHWQVISLVFYTLQPNVLSHLRQQRSEGLAVTCICDPFPQTIQKTFKTVTKWQIKCQCVPTIYIFLESQYTHKSITKISIWEFPSKYEKSDNSVSEQSHVMAPEQTGSELH